MQEIHDAILAAFNYDGLKRVLAYNGYDLEEITLAGDFSSVVADAVEYFSLEGLLHDLIKILQSSTQNPKVLALSWEPEEVTDKDMSTSQEIHEFKKNLEYIRTVISGIEGVKNSGLLPRVDKLEEQVDHITEVLEMNRVLEAKVKKENTLRLTLIVVSVICAVSLFYGVWIRF